MINIVIEGDETLASQRENFPVGEHDSARALETHVMGMVAFRDFCAPQDMVDVGAELASRAVVFSTSSMAVTADMVASFSTCKNDLSYSLVCTSSEQSYESHAISTFDLPAEGASVECWTTNDTLLIPSEKPDEIERAFQTLEATVQQLEAGTVPPVDDEVAEMARKALAESTKSPEDPNAWADAIATDLLKDD